jgi:hypothetical protein
MKRVRHLLGTAMLLAATTEAHAATFNVADGDVARLIAAIQQANSTPGLDTIVLATNGNYTLAQVHNTVRGEGPNGLPIVVDDLMVVGNGAVIRRAPNAPAFRFFYVSGPANLELQNLTLHNGRQTANDVAGGAILAHGNLILSACVLSSNVSTTPYGRRDICTG